MTIVKRKEFEKALNESISDVAFAELRGSEQQIRAQIKEYRDFLKRDDVQKAAKLGSWGPLVRTAEGMLDIFAELDGPSMKALKAAAKNEFRWLRFEPDTVKLVFPVTPECAKRLTTGPKAKDWLKEMRGFVEPIDLLAEDAGLVILIGKKGQAIRLTYVDNTEHEGRRRVEQALADHVGSPKALILNGKPANADRLIEQFIAEKKP